VVRCCSALLWCEATMKVDQLILLAQVLEVDPNTFLQQDSVIINMDNAKIDNAGSFFNHTGIVNQNETNKEVLEILRQLTELLRNVNSKISVVNFCHLLPNIFFCAGATLQIDLLLLLPPCKDPRMVEHHLYKKNGPDDNVLTALVALYS
jgi:hypothetical protein